MTFTDLEPLGPLLRAVAWIAWAVAGLFAFALMVATVEHWLQSRQLDRMRHDADNFLANTPKHTSHDHL